VAEAHDECGVAGVSLRDGDAAPGVYYALHALQHRGQESAGISVIDEAGEIETEKGLGLVAQVFTPDSLSRLRGSRAIGHVRYSTKGSSSWKNAQPVWRHDGRRVALSHNGNLINAVHIYKHLQELGLRIHGTSDSELICALLSLRTTNTTTLFDAVRETMPLLQGAYSTVCMSDKETVAFRDPAGIRPLVLGSLTDGYVVASETCALDILGADYVREVNPGECVRVRPDGIDAEQVLPARRHLCVFEHIYFARPDSMLAGRSTQQVRGRMGEILAEEAPVSADLVVAVPDSGNPAAGGYSRRSGIPRDEGLVKNRYVARTFIEPGSDLRAEGLRTKFNPMPAIVAGKRLVVVDDSIVRGNTTRRIVSMLRDAGASEVHLRVSSPAILHPCYYGIDMSTREEMIAPGKTPEEIAREVGADSLAYLSLAGVYRALSASPRDYCDACFSGSYPLGCPEGSESDREALEVLDDN
jgi:amidophosphoribosyltransferase